MSLNAQYFATMRLDLTKFRQDVAEVDRTGNRLRSNPIIMGVRAGGVGGGGIGGGGIGGAGGGGVPFGARGPLGGGGFGPGGPGGGGPGGPLGPGGGGGFGGWGGVIGISTAFSAIVDAARLVIGIFTQLAHWGSEFAQALIGAARKAAEFEAKMLSLRVIEGSAAVGDAAFSRLRQLAKQPGIGVEGAIQGYLGLRSAGVAGGFSERLIKEFGNLNALVGGGREEFKRIMYAVQQTANKPFAASEELFRQMSNAGVPMSRLLMQAFGTMDPKELRARGITSDQVLQRLVEVLEGWGRAPGGARNSWENAAESIELAIVDFGMGLNKWFKPFLDKLSPALDTGVAGGAFQSIGGAIVNMFDSFGLRADNMETLLIDLVAGTKTIIFVLTQTATIIAGILKAVTPWGAWMQISDTAKIYQTYRDETEGEFALGRAKQRRAAKNLDEFRKTLDPNQVLEADRAKPGSAADKLVRYASRTADALEKLVDYQERIIGGTSIGGSLSAIELGPGRPSKGRYPTSVIDFSLSGMLEHFFELKRLVEAEAGG